ncbi:basement membrane-specific heparan sulfate proteoglycan core protein-like isoform X4 [Hyperolius riggenbachi]|uniref:basement membrane-specific heparan sulfate proteoglycan core protein-like isoform X4 n=1 Tax=Hyperolius riggenbachi TaxID=752182 RepID=UPI0035A32793
MRSISSDEHSAYCTEQGGSIMVEEGTSVNIPCHFSYPENKNPAVVKMTWKQGRNSQCDHGFIYNYTDTGTSWTHKDYEGRIRGVGIPKEERKQQIVIQGIRKSDGPVFCCRTEIYLDGKFKVQWQTRQGTYILFKDEVTVEQPHVVLAVLGEDITIPCIVHNMPPDSIYEGIWRIGYSDLCWENGIFVNVKVNRTMLTIGQLSLIIRNVQSHFSGHYCCELKTRVKIPPEHQAVHGTQLVIADPNESIPEFKITQSGEISVNKGDAVIINCSYIVPPGKVPLWTGVVFWRVGSPRGIYAYHPSKLMVHPSYNGRTELKGRANLHLKEVQEVDNATYYCFVMLKFCIGPHSTTSMIQYGRGTQIKILGITEDEASAEQPDVILAVLGEDAAIPCIVHNINPESIREVTLRKGASDVCSENKEVKTRLGHDHIKEYVWQSPQENTWKLLLPIKKVRSSDIGQYCCDVRTTPEIPPARQPAHGTQVVIVDPKDSPPEFTATQPGEISAQRGDTVTINCLYHVPPGQTPLWIGVFWRVGGPSGIYAYHPYRLMVDSSYYGRTELEGLANLHIKDIVETDNATYYCFVMLKFCTGNHSAQSVIQYGGGTQLTIIGKPEDHNTSVQLSRQTVILVSYAAMKAFLLFIAVIFSFVYVKKCA